MRAPELAAVKPLIVSCCDQQPLVALHEALLPSAPEFPPPPLVPLDVPPPPPLPEAPLVKLLPESVGSEL